MEPVVRRIAMLSVHTCPLAVLGGKKTGGMNVYIRELSRELGRRGIKVDVFTRSQNPCIPHVNDMLGENARVIHVPTGPEAPLDPDQVYPYLPEFVHNVRAFAESEALHYDLIYSHYWLSGWAANLLREAWKVPVVQMFHTLGLMKDRIASTATTTPIASASDRPVAGPNTLRAAVETHIMSWADQLIAATPAERAQMRWMYHAPPHKIVVVPPGVNLLRFHPVAPGAAREALGLTRHCRMLLFVGRIEPLKGVDVIFQALAILKREAPDLVSNLCLSVIGGDPDHPAGQNAEMERLKHLRSQLELDGVVVFLGSKDQDTLNTYYAAAEALIMPSDYESFGMVALEAMASGTPVIASAVGGLAFLVRDGINGYLVPVREPAALAARIRLLLENPAQRAQLGATAAQDATAYAWPRIADQLLNVFGSVSEARRKIVAQ